VAPGLYDQTDGTVVAVGVLEHSDLEGGFWAIYRPAEPSSAPTQTVAVIANGAALESTLAPLAGRLVSAKGTRVDGASTRMAGPEIDVTEITGYAKGVQ
jgi:hypothetical protein